MTMRKRHSVPRCAYLITKFLLFLFQSLLRSVGCQLGDNKTLLSVTKKLLGFRQANERKDEYDNLEHFVALMTFSMQSLDFDPVTLL